MKEKHRGHRIGKREPYSPDREREKLYGNNTVESQVIHKVENN